MAGLSSAGVGAFPKMNIGVFLLGVTWKVFEPMPPSIRNPFAGWATTTPSNVTVVDLSALLASLSPAVTPPEAAPRSMVVPVANVNQRPVRMASGLPPVVMPPAAMARSLASRNLTWPPVVLAVKLTTSFAA